MMHAMPGIMATVAFRHFPKTIARPATIQQIANPNRLAGMKKKLSSSERRIRLTRLAKYLGRSLRRKRL